MGTLNSPPTTPPAKPPKLLDQVRDKIRLKHYSIRTEESYMDWVKRFVQQRLCFFIVEFTRKEIIIRDDKGFKNRVTILPISLLESLKAHLVAA
ncbi:MAG: hypothetical protein EPN21_04785 [Methylococcaceae bacterium]|nr:MAG: hypothetical protein EPN21_04785 [Methylococcaceae bacterium]